MADRYAWWRALRRSTLTPTARHVAMAVSTYMNKDGAGAWPSMATLADDTGRSRAVVKRAVRELRDTGWLTVESGGGRRADGGYVSNRYRASIPSGVVDAPSTASSGVVDEPPNEATAKQPGGSSHDGGGSSGEGGGSWTVGNGVVGDPRTAHELAIHHPKQHSATKSRAADAAERPSLNGEKEGQDQEQPKETVKARAFSYGETLGKEIAKGSLDVDRAVKMFDSAASIQGHFESFREGLKSGQEVAA